MGIFAALITVPINLSIVILFTKRKVREKTSTSPSGNANSPVLAEFAQNTLELPEDIDSDQNQSTGKGYFSK